MTKPNRVLITGIGLATPLGIGNHNIFDALCLGESNMQVVSEKMLVDGAPIDYVVGKVPADFEGLFEIYEKFQHGTNKPRKSELKNRSDRVSQLALIAALHAAEDSKIDLRQQKNVEIIVGTGIGGAQTLEENVTAIYSEAKRPSYFFIPNSIPGNICYWLAREFECDGESFPISTACASGTTAIGRAYRDIQEGKCNIVICGGAEACVTKAGLVGFGTTCKVGTLSKRTKEPKRASRPFDRNRDGFVLSEGAGILILESEKHFRERQGKRVYAEIVGYGSSIDKGHSLTEPNPETMILALQRAFPTWARPESVDYINAHGTSTRLNDPAEIKLYKNFFGEFAGGILVNSTKSMLGHSIGATGAIEAAVTAMSLYQGRVHPTLNLEDLDPECEGMRHVVGKTHEENIKCAISSSFAFGGHNSILVFEGYRDK